MEELVTVDEVGEDDFIIEPDLPELEKDESKESAEEKTVEELVLAPTSSSEVQETSKEKSDQDKVGEDSGDDTKTSETEKPENVSAATNPNDPKLQWPQCPAASGSPATTLSDFPSAEFKATLEEACLENNESKAGLMEESAENHISASEERKSQEATETVRHEVPHKDNSLKKGTSLKTNMSFGIPDKKILKVPYSMIHIIQKTTYLTLCL